MIEVKALDTYERLRLRDIELKEIPKKDRVFKVSKERLKVLLGDNIYKEMFVEVIEPSIEETEPNTEQVKVETQFEPKKTTMKKGKK